MTRRSPRTLPMSRCFPLGTLQALTWICPRTRMGRLQLTRSAVKYTRFSTQLRESPWDGAALSFTIDARQTRNAEEIGARAWSVGLVLNRRTCTAHWA